MNMLLYPIVLPFLIGIICLILPRKFKGAIETLAIFGSLLTFALTISIFLMASQPASEYLMLDNLSRFILLAIGLFGFLITLYSLKFMTANSRLNEYYGYILWTIGAATAVLLANNLILLLIFWGFLGLTLYLLIGIGGPTASDASKKTFIIVGGSDCLMILGIGILWFLSGTFQMDKISISLATGNVGVGFIRPAITGVINVAATNQATTLPTIAFLCLAIAAFAKAGAMPFHTWIPDCAEKAPIPVTAFLPASLDKLLGIYLLARIAMSLFVMNKAMGMVLLIVGAITIVAAVMMALIQHDLKRLLGYHAVSQVGYMLLGIGTGNPIGIAGGIFHMLNHALYKGCLFLCGGAVEHKTGISNLDKLGGLARAMPITFVTCLIAALSISGVPPFNGFVSKWMVYQGIIQFGVHSSGFIAKFWIIFLLAAMFGSALTLASFMKLIHATFLGQSANKLHSHHIPPQFPHLLSSPLEGEEGKERGEVSWTMWLPMVVLAGLCIIFGVFAYQIPLRFFISPSLSTGLMNQAPTFTGFWQPGLATFFIIIGLIIGGIIYLLGRPKAVREDTPFMGGEIIPEEHRVTGVDFYQTIEEMTLFKVIYKKAEAKLFDIYEEGKRGVFFFTKRLQALHSGILPLYLIWCLLGMVILFIILGK